MYRASFHLNKDFVTKILETHLYWREEDTLLVISTSYLFWMCDFQCQVTTTSEEQRRVNKNDHLKSLIWLDLVSRFFLTSSRCSIVHRNIKKYSPNNTSLLHNLQWLHMSIKEEIKIDLSRRKKTSISFEICIANEEWNEQNKKRKNRMKRDIRESFYYQSEWKYLKWDNYTCAKAIWISIQWI